MSTIAIHGGAGALSRAAMTPEKAAQYTEGLRNSLSLAIGILRAGGSSLDAVECAVSAMEDCSLFNAGKGSAFSREGVIEMEASIMDGKALKSGAVSLLRTVKNPVKLARKVMDCTPHAMLVGEAAERFAAEMGFAPEPHSYFWTRHRWEAMISLRGTEQIALSEDSVGLADSGAEDGNKMGTVGAVAVDEFGDLAAATSTGGTTGKYAGRIGDSPIVGAGVYAANDLCAVSCTGQGEYFMRGVVAYDIAAAMRYTGMGLKEAAADSIRRNLTEKSGRGGLVAVDRKGRITLPFNTEGMYRGWARSDGSLETAIYDSAW